MNITLPVLKKPSQSPDGLGTQEQDSQRLLQQ